MVPIGVPSTSGFVVFRKIRLLKVSTEPHNNEKAFCGEVKEKKAEPPVAA